ncbi:MAG: MmcQ/YjbR family DNA-binding protein [Bacteroidota bacterium]
MVITVKTFRKLALSFPETVELPHFERTSFRVKKKIFATLAQSTEIATLRFSKSDQSFFCSVGNHAIYPVPNKWGAHGWTFIELKKVSQKVILDALTAAYEEVTKQKSRRDGFLG